MNRERTYRLIILILAVLVVYSFWTEEKQEKETIEVKEEAQSYQQSREAARKQVYELRQKNDLQQNELDSLANLLAYISSGRNYVESEDEKSIYLTTMNILRDLSNLSSMEDPSSFANYFHPGYSQTLVRVYSDNGIKVEKTTFTDLQNFLESDLNEDFYFWKMKESKVIFSKVRKNVGTIVMEGDIKSQTEEVGKIDAKSIFILTYKRYGDEWKVGNVHISRYEDWN